LRTYLRETKKTAKQNEPSQRLRPDDCKFRSRLMAWYRKHCRMLPWRCEPTPYRVWISEIMLQQTQVAAASSYYVRFLERFPNLETLANASEQEVVALWSGLGYYSRARNLHKASCKIVQCYNGIFPADFKTILSLPGIGRYTAGAICSLALNQPQPIVDGNIRRVITRFNGIRNRTPEEYYWDQMKSWIPDGKASIFNQAMMELGALICTPFQPRCFKCPIKRSCEAHRLNLQNSLPQPRPKKPAQHLEMTILALRKKSKVLFVRNTPEFVPGEWGLPSCVIPEGSSVEETAKRLIGKLLSTESRLRFCDRIAHAIGHRRIQASIFAGESTGRICLTAGAFRWIEASKSKEILTSSLFLKALAKAEN
jgi:A/G-specific adenine glycosylase